MPAADPALLEALARGLHPLDPDPAALDPPAGREEEFLRLAHEQRALGLLVAALERRGPLRALPEALRVPLRRRVLEAEGQRAQLNRVAQRGARALAEAGIPTIALKGAALARLVYDSERERPMSDIDVLVEEERVDEALAALAGAGFSPPDAETLAYWREAFYNVALEPPEGLAGELELHWSIAQRGRHAPDLAGLFARARPLGLEGVELLALGPVDLLLHQVLHHAYHYFEPKLIWIHDIALLHRAGVDARETLARARAWGMRHALSLSTLQVEAAFPGCADAALLEDARRDGRVRALLAFCRADEPLGILRGWQSRRRQLAYGFLTIEGTGRALRVLGGWASRALRFGDRFGMKERTRERRAEYDQAFPDGSER